MSLHLLSNANQNGSDDWLFFVRLNGGIFGVSTAADTRFLEIFFGGDRFGFQLIGWLRLLVFGLEQVHTNALHVGDQRDDLGFFQFDQLAVRILVAG